MMAGRCTHCGGSINAKGVCSSCGYSIQGPKGPKRPDTMSKSMKAAPKPRGVGKKGASGMRGKK
jgi:hypothetical protein